MNISDRFITIAAKRAFCALHDVEKMQDDGLEENFFYTCDDYEETVAFSSGEETKANDSSLTGVDKHDDSSLEMSESEFLNLFPKDFLKQYLDTDEVTQVENTLLKRHSVFSRNGVDFGWFHKFGETRNLFNR